LSHDLDLLVVVQWYLMVALICIILITINADHIFWYVLATCISFLFGKSLLGTFTITIDFCLFNIWFVKFIYFGDKPFIRYMYCDYFPPIINWRLLFLLLNNIFQILKNIFLMGLVGLLIHLKYSICLTCKVISYIFMEILLKFLKIWI
jgi:hypothetical protein